MQLFVQDMDPSLFKALRHGKKNYFYLDNAHHYWTDKIVIV